MLPHVLHTYASDPFLKGERPSSSWRPYDVGGVEKAKELMKPSTRMTSPVAEASSHPIPHMGCGVLGVVVRGAKIVTSLNSAADSLLTYVYDEEAWSTSTSLSGDRSFSSMFSNSSSECLSGAIVSCVSCCSAGRVDAKLLIMTVVKFSTVL